MPDTTSGLEGAVEADNAETDGRRLRRARNREAAVEALIELYSEGHLSPSASEIALRAGLSPRSLFRYFDDMNDLVRAGIEHRARVILPLVERQLPTDRDRPTRIADLVALRLELHEAAGLVGRVARMRSWKQPLVSENLSFLRRVLRRQTRDSFAPELDQCSESERRRIVSAIELLTSFEAIELALYDQGFERDELESMMQTNIDSLLPASR
jgi:AcrR family transcriptional regulator